MDATGNPTPTYSLTTFPVGMTINATTGLISWTPGSIGDYNVTVQASNGVNPAANQSYVITVSSTAVCPAGMISYWKLDETSGNTYADAMGANTGIGGTVFPGPTSGRVNGGQQFNGSSSQINIAANPTLDFGAVMILR